MPTFAGMEQRDKFKGVESIKFYSRFTDDASCLEYLSSIKWADGFKCKKCGHTNYCNDRYPYSRRCTRCKYDESVTSGSMFDKIKFPLVYAFHIAFKISTKKKGMSSLELAEEYCMRQKTVWEFKRKIQKAMRSSGNYPLKGEVHVDEFYIGGEEEGIIGRSTEGKKKLVIVALEIVRDGVPLKKDYPKLEQRPSDKGKGHPQIHIHIMNIKGWLRGIHHHCSKEHLQGYLDEYHFRFNRRNNMDTIFDMLLRRMICQKKTD